MVLYRIGSLSVRTPYTLFCFSFTLQLFSTILLQKKYIYITYSLSPDKQTLYTHTRTHAHTHAQLAQSLTVGDNNNNNGGPGSSDNDHNFSQRSSLLDNAESGTASFHDNNNNKSKKDNNNNNNNNIDEEEALLSKDIHRAMSTMTELINTKMAPAAERTGRSQHSLLVKRYREILFNCGADYSKTSAAVARRREARELFRGASASSNGNGGDRDEGMEQLMRERNAIDNSMKSAAGVLNQAAGVRSELRSQGAGLRGAVGTMANIASNIPGLSGLIDKIRVKRQQDDRVVSGVVAMCILFTLWYLFGREREF